MLGNGAQSLPGGVVEQQDLALGGGIVRLLLPQQLDHHIVGGFINKGDHYLLAVHQIVSVGILGGGGIGHLPHKVPGKGLGQLISQLFHKGLVHVAGLGGAHIGDGIVVAVKGTFLQELGNDLLPRGAVELHRTAPQTVFRMAEQPVQRHHGIGSGEIGGDVVGIGDAHVGSGFGGNIGDDIVIDAAVIGIKPQIDLDIGIQLLKIGDGLFINSYLGQVGVVFCPEGDLVLSGFVKALRNGKGVRFSGAVTAAQGQQTAQRQKQSGDLSHPLVPPLETPSMILLRKIRNSTISGREMTTTAAIMAGMFSRPKPLSRMVWMPLDTRK